MIYTVTFNPSLDYIVTVQDFTLGITNRTESELILPGGKGLNVSMVLKNLGVESTAFGFLAGFTGEEIRKRLEKLEIQTDFIYVNHGISRINLKLKNIEGTEINGRGMDIEEVHIAQLMKKLRMLQKGDILVLAGSIPHSLSKDMYQKILMELQHLGIRFVIDAGKELLVNTLEYETFLIKPNNYELGEIFGIELTTRESVIPYGKKLQELGAKNVLISLAGEGAVLVAENGVIYESPAPKGMLINGVGAGDSMIAGFLSGWLEGQDYEHAFYMGIAAGSASAFSEYLATKEEVLGIYNTLINTNKEYK